MASLNLYRRHGSHCTGGRALHAMTYEGDELRRTWKRCDCPIYASGTLHRTFKRKNTERTAWDEAKIIVRSLEEAKSWTGTLQPPPAPAAPASEPVRVTLADAIKAYLAVREGRTLAPATLRKSRTFCKHLQGFADTKGYVMVDQIT